MRTLERSGVPRSTAMAMVGHKTESIYRRYAIVDEQMHREAAAKLDAWADALKSTLKDWKDCSARARTIALDPENDIARLIGALQTTIRRA